MNSNNITREDFLKLSGKTLIGALLFGSSSVVLDMFIPKKAYASSPYSFVSTICEEARDIAQENNIHASVMLAQAIIESASGSSGLSKAPNYNLFGIKGRGTAGSVIMGTSEDDGSGNYYSISSGFRKYYSWQESMEDYAALIRGNSAYRGAWLENTGGDYRRATSALQGNYASSTSYASTLNGAISSYGLAQYDNPRDYSIDGVRLSKIISFSRLNSGKNYEKSIDFIIEAYKWSYDFEIKEDLESFHEVNDDYRISDVVVLENGSYGVFIGTDLIAVADNSLDIIPFEQCVIVKHYRYNNCLNEDERHILYIKNLEKELKASLENDLVEKDKSILSELNELYDFE